MFALTSLVLVQLSSYRVLAQHVCLLQHSYELHARSAGNQFSETSGNASSNQSAKQKDWRVTGDSHSIGNAISVWLADAISRPRGLNLSLTGSYSHWPEDRFVGQQYHQCHGDDNMCFGKYLFKTHGEVPLSVDQLTTVNAEMHARHKGGQMMYLTSVIKVGGVSMGNLLHTKVVEYAQAFNPLWLAPVSRRHCVVHYRVGDFVEYTQKYRGEAEIVNAKSVAAAMSSFDPSPLTVEILNGGISHFPEGLLPNHSQVMEDTEKARSVRFLHKLKHAISEAFPAAHVQFGGTRTTDEDWFRLAQAPLAVVAMGSFGVSAAMAGANNQVRSPATRHLLNVHDQIAPTQIRPGWTTYRYELEDWNAM